MNHITLMEDRDLQRRVGEAAKTLARASVNIGLAADHATHPGGLATAALLSLLEHGSPVNRTPPRPVVAPALENPETRAALTAALGEACEAAAGGDEAGMKAALEAAGKIGVEAIRTKIRSGTVAPNAPFTLSGGWMRNRVSGKPFYAPPKKGSTPLINTGFLLEAFDSEVNG